MEQEETAQEEPWVPEDNFGNRLVLVRKTRGLSQEEAAAVCGLDKGSWSNWENGSKPNKASGGLDGVVQTISDALNVKRDWLMWGSTSARLFQTHLTGLPSMLDRRSTPDRRSPEQPPPVLTLVRHQSVT